MKPELLRALPKMDLLLARPALAGSPLPYALRRQAARQVLDEYRAALRAGALSAVPGLDELEQSVLRRGAELSRPALGRVINATGVVLTKLDGTPRGGCAVSVWENLGLPIRFIGVGEKIDDLMEFDAQTFVESLLPESALQKDEKKEEGESEA